MKKCWKLQEKYDLRKLSGSSDSDNSSRRRGRKFVNVPRRALKIAKEQRSRKYDLEGSSDESSDREVVPYRRIPIKRTSRVNEDRLLKQISENLNDYRLVFGEEKKDNAEEFLERLDECRELTRASDELWMSSI